MFVKGRRPKVYFQRLNGNLETNLRTKNWFSLIKDRIVVSVMVNYPRLHLNSSCLLKILVYCFSFPENSYQSRIDISFRLSSQNV